jgi:MurNAc alpha-1-phosphate uridylyltransferase
MHAGIFAAGFGSRLRLADANPNTPKGLVRVAGRPLVDWVLSDLAAAGVTEAVVIINQQSTSIRDHVDRDPPVPVRWLVETTTSSMHSFLRVLEELARDGRDGPFLMTTVDTIAPAGTFRRFLAAATGAPSDVVLALTTLIDDEHPLRIGIESGAAGPSPVTSVGTGPFATAGYYLVGRSVLQEAAAGRASRLAALRLFLKHLFDRGYRISGVPMPDSVDVDRPADIASAERVLRAGTP